MRNQSDTAPPQLRAHRLAKLVLFPAVLLSAPWAAQATCTGACPPSAVGLSVNPSGQAYRQQSVALTANVARGKAGNLDWDTIRRDMADAQDKLGAWSVLQA